jgi:5-methylcytosine-specific restriction endonuclease McrA/peptidoglycan hydrolase-like protein with peptidoglycan-binding domain
LPKTSLHKKIGLKLVIIASCILIPFLFSYAENKKKIDENGAVPVNKSNRQSLSSKSDMSKNVKQIQTLLALLKFNPGPIDGILGKKTTRAIRTFQLDIGVLVTGKIGENLKSQLDKAYRLSVTRTKEQTRDDKEKPQIGREKTSVTASQDTKLFSEPDLKASKLPATKRAKKSGTGKEPEVKRQKKIETGPQKELTPKDRNLKPENQYLKYIKISFPVIAIIFFAYFYRIWTRLHEKRRDEKGPQKAKTEAQRPQRVKPEAQRSEKEEPEEEYEALSEIQELEKEKTDTTNGKAELDQQDPMDQRDPLQPGYITPVVRRKVWIRNKGQCAACGSRKDLQYDYIVPISEGGHNTLDNLQLLCKTCNQEKSDK